MYVDIILIISSISAVSHTYLNCPPIIISQLSQLSHYYLNYLTFISQLSHNYLNHLTSMEILYELFELSQQYLTLISIVPPL